MKPFRYFAISMMPFMFLAACSSAPGPEFAEPGAAGASGSNEATSVLESVRLTQDFTGALSIQSQLAAGTLLLEDTDLAVEEALAGELLPLWQAVQSLSDSDTAAAVEIEAVLNQIQDTMRPEQVASIAGMQLTEESLTEMLETETISLGRGGVDAGQGADGAGPGAGFGGFGGGRPEGFGGGPPGGGAGFGGQGLEPDTIATRQAEFASGDGASFQERETLGAVIRLLGTKTGEVAADRRGSIIGIVFVVAAEATGLTTEEIQTQMSDGAALTDILEAGGADLANVRIALVDAFYELPNADELDVEGLADQWLGMDE